MTSKKIIILITVIILIIGGILITFSIIKTKEPSQKEIEKELEELKGNYADKTIFGKPTYYSKNAIIEYVKWKYGDECRLDNVKKEGNEYIYKFIRDNRNDFFYIISQTSNIPGNVAGPLDHTKWIRIIENEYDIRYDITMCHLEEIEKLANQRNLKIEITTDELSKQVYIKAFINNIKNERIIENLANYAIDLDNLLHYDARPYSIEVEYETNTKSFWIDLSSGNEERKEHTKEYYTEYIKEKIEI